MQVHWAWLIVALQVGVLIGIFLIALLQMSRTEDNEPEGGQ